MKMKEYLSNVCRRCFAYMSLHPDYYEQKVKWLKCPTCGFCKREKDLEDVEKEDGQGPT